MDIDIDLYFVIATFSLTFLACPLLIWLYWDDKKY